MKQQLQIRLVDILIVAVLTIFIIMSFPRLMIGAEETVKLSEGKSIWTLSTKVVSGVNVPFDAYLLNTVTGELYLVNARESSMTRVEEKTKN